MSPHADDVAFSAAGQLARDVAGRRARDRRDAVRAAGSRSGAAEDEAFARAFGVTLVRGAVARRDRATAALSLAGAAVRAAAQPTRRRWSRRCARRCRRASTRGCRRVVAPLGVGGHVDHQVAHAACRALTGADVAYYEDTPYVLTPYQLPRRLARLDADGRPQRNERDATLSAARVRAELRRRPRLAGWRRRSSRSASGRAAQAGGGGHPDAGVDALAATLARADAAVRAVAGRGRRGGAAQARRGGCVSDAVAAVLSRARRLARGARAVRAGDGQRGDRRARVARGHASGPLSATVGIGDSRSPSRARMALAASRPEIAAASMSAAGAGRRTWSPASNRLATGVVVVGPQRVVAGRPAREVRPAAGTRRGGRARRPARAACATQLAPHGGADLRRRRHRLGRDGVGVHLDDAAAGAPRPRDERLLERRVDRQRVGVAEARGGVEGRALGARSACRATAARRRTGSASPSAGDAALELGVAEVAGAHERLDAAHLAGDDAVVAGERLFARRGARRSPTTHAVAVATHRQRRAADAWAGRRSGVPSASKRPPWQGQRKPPVVVERHRAAHVGAAPVERQRWRRRARRTKTLEPSALRDARASRAPARRPRQRQPRGAGAGSRVDDHAARRAPPSRTSRRAPMPVRTAPPSDSSRAAQRLDDRGHRVAPR